MATYIRPPKDMVDLNTLDGAKRDYIAGVLDTDGSFGVDRGLAASIKVTQALKGYPMIEWLYDHVGGLVNKQLDETDKHQAAFTWGLVRNADVVRFAAWIAPNMTVKRREALLLTKFPEQHLHIADINARNLVTGEERTYPTIKAAAMALHGKHVHLKKDASLTMSGWQIQRSRSTHEVTNIRVARQEIRELLMTYHHTEHDAIPDSFKPSMPYVAGLIDGEGCLDAHGKTSQHHTMSQKYRPLLDMLSANFGGTVCRDGSHHAFEWAIFTCDKADRLLHDIEPYLVGKKEQARLIINMAPGDAESVHARLRDMKGRINRDTRKIGIAQQGGSANNFKLPPKKLPTGVNTQPNGTFVAHLGVDTKDYSLGTFATVEQAKAQYDKYKAIAQRERRTGVKEVDWEDLFRLKTNAMRLPEPADHNEKNIYTTASRTYQVKVHNKAYGTFETLEEAIRVRDQTKTRLEEEDARLWDAYLASEYHIKTRITKKDGLVYDVKIGGAVRGAAIATVAEAKRLRDKIVIEENGASATNLPAQRAKLLSFLGLPSV